MIFNINTNMSKISLSNQFAELNNFTIDIKKLKFFKKPLTKTLLFKKVLNNTYINSHL